MTYSPTCPNRCAPTAKARAKLVEIVVEGGLNPNQSARRIAMSIANSPLVKTAIAGETPNWGREVMRSQSRRTGRPRQALDSGSGGIRVAHKGARDDPPMTRPPSARR